MCLCVAACAPSACYGLARVRVLNSRQPTRATPSINREARALCAKCNRANSYAAVASSVRVSAKPRHTRSPHATPCTHTGTAR